MEHKEMTRGEAEEFLRKLFTEASSESIAALDAAIATGEDAGEPASQEMERLNKANTLMEECLKAEKALRKGKGVEEALAPVRGLLR